MQENKFPKGVMVTYGVGEAGPRGGRTSVQSLAFDRKLWTLTKAKAWLADHGFLYGKVHETPGFWRFRQEEPKGFERYRAVKYNPLDAIGVESIKFEHTGRYGTPEVTSLESFKIFTPDGIVQLAPSMGSNDAEDLEAVILEWLEERRLVG